MNTSPNQPDRDPAFDALLDDALSPPPAPPGLADRIVQATRHQLPNQPQRPAVIARIGAPAGRWAVATATLAAACLVLAIVYWPNPTTPLENTTLDHTTVTADGATDFENEWYAVDTDVVLNTNLDRELQLLRLDIELAQLSGSDLPAEWDDGQANWHMEAVAGDWF